MKKNFNIKFFKKIPDKPGVYLFKHKNQILYIGKATSLKNRTKSYFANDLMDTRGPLIADLIFKTSAIDWQETESVLEALILEAELIKKHQPYYNTKEKDNKSFNVVCITKESFPKVLVLRERSLNTLQEEDDIKFQAKYGPFTNGSQLKEAMKIIRHIFPYLDSQSSKPDNFQFYRQLGLTPEVGTKKAKNTYAKNIKNLRLFFEGKKKKVLKNLEKEMKEYAKIHQFEKAGEIKRQIFAIKHINDVALLKQDKNERKFLANSPHPNPLLAKERRNSNFRIEAYDVAHMGGKNMTGVMTVVEDSEVNKNEYRKFKIRTQTATNDTGALKEVLERRFAHPEWQFPDLIAIDGSTAQMNVAKKVLAKNDLKIPVVAVVKDERHKPKDILGDEKWVVKYKREILLGNSEAHRFAISYHKNIRDKNFLI